MSNKSESTSDFQWDWNLPRLFIRRCRQKGDRLKVADTSGVKLTGNELLLRTLALKRIIDREVLRSRFTQLEDEKHVGVLLPPTVPAVVVNMALTLSRRVAVNLNYTVSESIVNRCIEQAQIKHVITSRKVIDKLGMNLNAKVVYLEDLKEKATLADKIVAFTESKFMTEGMLASRFELHKNKPDDRLTIIFTSGSTGNPKGVPLTFNNIASNVQGFDATIQVKEEDCFLGILPFFHSFGYTGTLWAVGSLPCSGAFHYNPLEPKQIGKLIETYKCSIVLGTPTFLRGFLKRIEPEQFKTVNVVVVGAEKMPIPLAHAFEERFGVRPIEGYGTTELSPVVAVNVPPSRARNQAGKDGLKEGSVGRPIPAVKARTVSLDDHSKVLGPDQTGMIEISGPNVMAGYLNQPELTAKVMNDGWYITGDVGFIDSDGFIHITGRESRFSKIGGEMVPHIQIEEELNRIVGAEDTLKIAVCGVPDEKKGERLVVLYAEELPEEPSAIVKKLIEAGLPSIYVPGADSFIRVDAIPILGTGKLDLRGLQALAKERAK
ncbi:MAG: AMP-binding protein [Planctomycetota bacterium]|jgi:acyl-[acyl-carrier-protein]-phospholipid O-acyltransferase/long-chain-fatty-acid--[acyl-carrier-protein] ligase